MGMFSIKVISSPNSACAMGWKQSTCRSCLLKKLVSTAGISKKVDKLRKDMEECISAGKQPGDGVIYEDI